MMDWFLVAIVALVAWTVAAEGAWGAAFVFLSVLFSGLVAMDLFEPFADLFESYLPAEWSIRVDFIALVGLFAAGVFGLRFLSERLVPSFIAVHPQAYDACRWGFGVLTGYVTMAFLLTALHTAPLPREFLGFRPEREMFFGAGPDRQWLGFCQYVSEKSLSSSEPGRVFDGAQFALPYHETDASGEPPKWSNFIIRYATRREMGGSIVDTSVGGAPAPGVPSSGGSGTGGM